MAGDGTWERLLQQVQTAADAAGEIDWDISVDSTIMRAHQHRPVPARSAAGPRVMLEDLAADYTVVAPDLRGYGLSDKPVTGYDKRRMAADMAGLVESLGFERAAVVGHDRGARVAHRWALDRPEQVERLAVLRSVCHRG
ncbi:pimeloyl-ACP methyl ester carboxylesterase [Streptomyces sp. V4I23]|nr:pimeloyl-ACP methyl ester carboxylesterase [Streptomyces sp. V4I23]